VQNLLWPSIRWQDDLAPELAGLYEQNLTPHFFTQASDVPDEIWRTCDAILGPPVSPKHMEKLDRCRIYVKPAVGYDEIDLAAWADLGIPVCNTPNYGTREVADHAMALALTLMKSIAFHDESLRCDPINNWRPAMNPFGQRLSNCRAGIVGLGRIGTATALRLKAFDMDVSFYDPYKPNGADLALGIDREESLEALFGSCDLISLHLPLNDETGNLINATVLDCAKPGLILINTARGPIVDIDAVYQALKADKILAAGLDVLPDEPANMAAPLIKAWHEGEAWLKHRLIVTPHSAFFTPQSMYDIRNFSTVTAVKYLTTGRLDNCVNDHLLKHRRGLD